MWPFRRHDPDPADLRLVVGLGNPGPRYEKTRHNIGFMVVNELARRGNAAFKASRQQADVARVTLDGIPILLAQPLTYMNESGRAVSLLMHYYRVPLDRLLIVCDDIDLPFGTIRLRPSGSSGGQKGLRSIMHELHTEDFARLRLGVSRPRGQAASHVLAPFPPGELRALPELVGIAADAVLAALRDGTQPAINAYNRNWLTEVQR
ncbi:MAG TPA: aminoacyl-tRNA hydrolase [Chloroflexota bacterium]|nr:aminoacyl-tRNA hydrolase [Chloroflexota bacterium]